jgi:iron complex transport system permease protein
VEIAGERAPNVAVSSSVTRLAALLLCALALCVVALLSLRIGSVSITNADAFNGLFNYSSESYEQTVVRSLRLPRTMIGLGVGAALAVAGAAMQAATRNPLAGPETLGVNSGAAFGIVTAVYLGLAMQPQQLLVFAFIGGLAAAAVVYAIGSAGTGGASPIKLALAGVIVSALLGSWQTALLLLDQQTLDVVRFWLAGALAGRDLNTYLTVLPFLVVGTTGIVLLSHQLNILSMGDDTARALGMHTGRTRALLSVLVVLLASASVAVAGPIGFVGLAVPHIVRVVAGPDYRWILAFCLFVGPLLLLSADVGGRVIARPSEVQVGIVTALLGAPFLIALARQRRIAEL